MKSMVIRLGLPAIVLLLVVINRGCANGEHLEGPSHQKSGRWNDWKETKDYNNRNPIAEARRDFQVGDRGIYSALGYAKYYPGLDRSEAQTFPPHQEKPIPKTSDAIESQAHRRYIEAATDFAERYNLEKQRLVNAE